MDPPSLPTRDAAEKQARDVVGQFSATQTTVITTTTTTTTEFPPLMMRAPNENLDPKDYPLASSPTPQSIKKLFFDVEGRPTVFQEADDTFEALERHKQKRKALRDSHGELRSVSKFEPGFGTARSQDHKVSSFADQKNSTIATNHKRKRAASPVSISEAAVLANKQGNSKRRHLPRGKASSSLAEGSVARRSSRSRLQIVQTSTPITPCDRRSGSSAHEKTAWYERGLEALDSSRSSTTMDSPEGNDDEAQILSPKSEVTSSMSYQDDEIAYRSSRTLENDDAQSSWQGLGLGSAITPHMAVDSANGLIHSQQPERPRPTALDTAVAQDASLPSPSLSPVTAAANMQSRRSYFEVPVNGQPGSSESLHSLPSQDDGSGSIQKAEEPAQDLQVAITSDLESSDIPVSPGHTANSSLMKLPSLVEGFEAMPEEMKKYLVYQYLRRCSKGVLHFIADVVNPALKCDFIRTLPLELSLTVIGHLDAKTLCRAAQVSKKWRQVIDSSETTWKRLFDANQFVLSEDELLRAVREGWGWQFATRPNEHEMDLSAYSASAAPPSSRVTNRDSTDPLAIEHEGLAQARRAKRKAKSKSKPSNWKHQKRKQATSISSLEFDDEAQLERTITEGPHEAAGTAATAVVDPPVGLSSIRNLHLFKSIYMRHHNIRKSWMSDEEDGVAPRHIAFRAHQRHVVTCLQFDSDKILTGSDDAKINVYDSKTGVLRAILEGHEGGVWALQYEGNVLVSGSTDRTVRVWDIKKGICTHVFHGHTSTVRCLQILKPTLVGRTRDGRDIMMPEEPLILTGSRDSNLRVWKLPKPEDDTWFGAGPGPDESPDCPYFVRALTGHHHSVRAIAAHADTLVSGSYDCSVRVWKISNGETVYRLNGHSQKVYSVVLDIKRNRVISGSMDNCVKVWSLDTGTVLFNLEGHSSLVGLLDLQQDRLVSAAADSTLRIWDPETGYCRSTLTAHTGAITCFQHDGEKVISGSDRTLKMWNVKTGEFARDLLVDLSGVWQVKFDERRCVAAVQRNNMTYIEVMDFGATRDGIPLNKRGKRIVVNVVGQEVTNPDDQADAEMLVDDQQ